MPVKDDVETALELDQGIAGNGITEEALKARGRECPVPKPGGIIGQVLGFKSERTIQPVIEVEPVQQRASRSQDQES